MAASRPAAGGGRWVDVAPERLQRWLDGFAERHGGAEVTGRDGEQVVLSGADGARAEVAVPFPPLAEHDDLVEHALRARRTGVVLVRLGGFACGVAEGDRLVVSKVGSRPVHGRSAAGGQSQQRFARRREGQARVALQAAADTVSRVLLPHAGSLEAVVAGGDRAAVDAVLSDRRLAPLRALLSGPLLDVPEPRHAVLEDAVRRLRAVRVRVVDPPDVGGA